MFLQQIHIGFIHECPQKFYGRPLASLKTYQWESPSHDRVFMIMIKKIVVIDRRSLKIENNSSLSSKLSKHQEKIIIMFYFYSIKRIYPK